METSLRGLKIGMSAVVLKVNTAPAVTCRLRDLGLVPGTRVCCRYRDPWGDVTALECRGAVLALRSSDLEKIRVRY